LLDQHDPVRMRYLAQYDGQFICNNLSAWHAFAFRF